MASVIGTVKMESTEIGQPTSKDSMATDVQSYLITRYREALKKGDKSAAKSCLLAARCFSVNDPCVTNEIYIMAKSDGDVNEASKCFANIFNDLFLVDATPDSKINSADMLPVISVMKEETRILLGELKSKYLKLKSLPAPASLVTRQAPTVNSSPLLSPRVRMSSEDRVLSRESISKLDNHLHSSAKSLFYQQLFDNLPNDVRKSILDHSIDTCDNPFEKCRLIMLAITLFSGEAQDYGKRLLRILMDQSCNTDKADSSKGNIPSSRCLMMTRYAKSLLALDAIPLVLNSKPILDIEVEFEGLFERTLSFFSEHCLELAANEYDVSELHDGVKKAITARILGTENTLTSDESLTEENLMTTLELISRKFLETISDDELRKKLADLRSYLSDRTTLESKYDKVLERIHNLMLTEEIPEDILFISSKDELVNSQPVATPPPKGRGRPKKQTQLPSSQEDEAKKHFHNKAQEVQFVFYSIVQYIFVNCGSYLKSTKSRILINFDNPLAASIESQLVKNNSQRTSRSKSSSQVSNDSSGIPTKKPRLDHSLSDIVISNDSRPKESPLCSEYSKMMDERILAALVEAQKFIGFMSSSNGPFTKLWSRFLNSSQTNELQWFKRFSVDSVLILGNYSELPKQLVFQQPAESDESEIKMDQSSSTVANLTIGKSSIPTNIYELRGLVQMISCYVQLLDKQKTLDNIDLLISMMKKSGAITNDEKEMNNNPIDEYMTYVKFSGHEKLGFLFFDSWSLMRYCCRLLMETLKRFISNSVISDAALGHTIVLSQFDWPKESSTYNQCLTWLRVHKPKSTTPHCLSANTKFTYSEFFQYVKNPHMIEDFMALLCRGYTLDIKNNGNHFQSNLSQQSKSSAQSSTGSNKTTSNSSSRSGKAITTRGVNKTFKYDLKISMINQMRNSSILMTLNMVSDFIQTTLVPYLLVEIKT